MSKNTNPPLTIVPTSINCDSPPKDLGESGGNLWRRIQAEYAISDSGGREMLSQACKAADRLASLAETIEQDGPIVHTRQGPKRHPALGAELACRDFIVRTLAKLGLNFEPVLPPGKHR